MKHEAPLSAAELFRHSKVMVFAAILLQSHLLFSCSFYPVRSSDGNPDSNRIRADSFCCQTTHWNFQLLFATLFICLKLFHKSSL